MYVSLFMFSPIGQPKTHLTYSIIEDTRLDVVVPSLPSDIYHLYVINRGGNAIHVISF